MSVLKGSIRRNQLITTYGVGAMIPVGDESVMVAGLDDWPVGQPDIHEPRLERSLGVRGFVLPPASGDDKRRDVPVVRFPTIYSCPSCRRLDRHQFFAARDQNKCNVCQQELIPSRFVVVCERGHIDDFPYFEWVHAGTKKTDDNKHILKIETVGESASLASIVIRCSCGKTQTMRGAFGRAALKGIKRCAGRRPWLGANDQVDCSCDLRTLQRGASNTYFGVVQSALSIPPWSQGALKIINRSWLVLQHVPEAALADTIKGMKLAEGTPYSVKSLVEAVLARKAGESGSQLQGDLREQEYEAFLTGKEEVSREQDFVCVPSPEAVQEVGDFFDQVMLAKRLREVRALQEFTRLLPPTPADDKSRRAPLSKGQLDWLPAIEVVGEGVFLKFRTDAIAKWESNEDVQKQAARIDANYRARFSGAGRAPDRAITPRLILTHTLAHVLITQWSLDCGYPAASLRERLFVSQPNAELDMCGLLIYTATSDAAGSLGGVVAQAEGGRLGPALAEAIQRTSWCSSDPLCIEADATGVDALNLAACHACVLLPETSCEEGNMLLDRGLLVGTPDNPKLGFFSPLLQR
jgi:hypothetical protein